MRLIDRPIRPLFPETYLREVQIMSMVLSADKEMIRYTGYDRRLLLCRFKHSILAHRFCKSWSGQWRICYQSYTFELAMSNIDLVVSGTENAVTMVEASGKEVLKEMVDAIMSTCIYQRNCTTPKELLSKCGKKTTYPTLKNRYGSLEEIKRNIILIY